METFGPGSADALLKDGSVFAVENDDGSDYTFYKFGELPSVVTDDTSGQISYNTAELNSDSFALATLDDLVTAGYALDTTEIGEKNYSINELLNPSEPIEGNPFGQHGKS